MRLTCVVQDIRAGLDELPGLSLQPVGDLCFSLCAPLFRSGLYVCYFLCALCSVSLPLVSSGRFSLAVFHQVSPSSPELFLCI